MSKPVISNTFSLTAIKQGDDGTPGGNTATLFLFKRSATPITAIDWNYALTYNFASQSLSSTPSGWTLNKVPAGTDPVYVTAATAYSTETTDSIAASEWSTPVLYTENTNAATIFLFKRSATAITAHGITSDNVYYKFADGKLYNGTGSSASVISDLNGWTRNIPTDDGKPCYVIQATAVGTGTHDQILHTEWSDVTKLVEDGKGISSADVLFCLANSQTTAPGDSSFTATSFAGLNIKNTDADKYVWQCIKTTYTSGNPTYGGKVCLGKVSDFASVVEQYALGTASAATGTWQNDTPPSAEKGKYLWTRTKLTYSDNSVSYSPSEAGQCIGYFGTDGKGITSADILFCLGTSQTTAPGDSSFTATSFAGLNIKNTDADKYVWQCIKTTYTSGNPTYGGKVCLGKVSDFASVVEQYALGTASAATGTWQNDTPPSAEKGKYLWTRTKLTYSDNSVSYSPSEAGQCLGYYGNDGNNGNGISSDNFYYCQTPTIEPPQTTYLTETYGWYLRGSANCPTAPTGKNNYLWECRYIQYSVDTSQNKKILRLVMMRDTDIKPNLLEQTAFDSEDSMDQWMYSLGSISNKGEVIPQARGGMNAFGAFPTSASEKDFLQQLVFEPGTLAKIQSNEWYTLSFYARTRRYINQTNNTYGFYFQDIYLKAGTYKLQFNGHCSSAARAASQPVQLNGYLFKADWSKQVQASITSKIDTTITTGTLTVTTADTYKIGFYAYKSAMVGGDAGENVTVNWWRIISVSDNSQIYTFLYPSAVKNGSTYFVDGVVKSSLAADCNVCWQLDEDADDCDNLGWTRHSVTFQTKSSITEAIQKVLFRMYKTYVEICMIKLEQNAMATEWCENEHDVSTECSHNPCGTWAPGVTYYYCNGQRDVVRALDGLGGGMTWFRMKKRTSSAGYTSNTFPFLDTEHWEKGNKLKFTIVDTMFAEEIFTDKLTVTKLKTTGDDSYIDMHDGEIDFFGRLGFPNIVLGIDSNGCAVLKFYDKDGNFKYDLGPDGIMDNMDSLASSMVSVGELGAYDMTQSWSYARERALPNVSTSPYYRFSEGWTKTGNVKKYHVSGTSTPSSYNNKVYNSKNMTTGTSGYPTGTKIASGYYLGKELMRPMAAQEIGDTVSLYSRRVYDVGSEGAVPVLLGELCYLKGEHVNDTKLADLEGNPLSCSTSHNMLYYIQNANNTPTLQA